MDTLNGTNTVSGSSPSGLKTDTLIAPLSLLTCVSSCSPVQPTSTEELRTWLAQAFPANRTASQAIKWGGGDARDMWPATVSVIRAVQPKFAWLENVPGLVSLGYLARVLGDLAALGFDAEWGCISAGEQGAPHMRERLWIRAHTNGAQLEGMRGPIGVQAEHAHLGGGRWWKAEPRMDRVADGLAHRVDRLKAIGNGQVPGVVARAWGLLT